MKITKTLLNNYTTSDLCLLLTLNGKGYVTKKYKKEFVDYIYDNIESINIYFSYHHYYCEGINYDKYQTYYEQCIKKKSLNKEFLKEYYTNYFNMKIIFMTVLYNEDNKNILNSYI